MWPRGLGRGASTVGSSVTVCATEHGEIGYMGSRFPPTPIAAIAKYCTRQLQVTIYLTQRSPSKLGQHELHPPSRVRVTGAPTVQRTITRGACMHVTEDADGPRPDRGRAGAPEDLFK
jgi:hypothetical protein